MAYWNHSQSIKEVAKHFMFKTGMISLLDKKRQAQGRKVSHLQGQSSEARFQTIYETGAWKMHEGQQSLSGTGSEDKATLAMRTALADIVKRYNCKTFLDVGCGDWTWMQHVELPCNYIGVDIVPSVIAANRERHAKQGVKFLVADAIQGPLPQADIAFVREILFHLSCLDGMKTLTNIKKSCKWLIATTDRLWFNSDIRTGDFRMINLQLSPYSLPQPDFEIRDDTNVKGRVMAVWPTSAIPHYPLAFDDWVS